MPPPPRTIRLFLALVVLFALYLARHSFDGLTTAFLPDDLMNLYWYWERDLGTLLRWILVPSADAYRPMGAVFYRPLYEVFGLSPLPYRIVCFALLLLNLGIAAKLYQRLLPSPLAWGSASLFSAYHAYLADLYYSSATIFDLLAFSTFFLGLLAYLSWRESGSLTAGRRSVVLLLLFLSIQAKELAAIAPILLIAHELWRFPPGRRDFLTPLLGVGISLVYLFPRLTGSNPMVGNAAYSLSTANLWPNLQRYTDLYFCLQGSGPGWLAAGLALAVIALLICPGDPNRRFMALGSMLLPIPALLIAPRSLYICYLAMFFWNGLLAYGLSQLLSADRRTIRQSAAILILLALGLDTLHRWRKPYGNAWVAGEADGIAATLSHLRRQYPNQTEIARPARVLFVEDPFPGDSWALTFLFRLYFRNLDIEVVRMKLDPGIRVEKFDHVVTYPTWSNFRAVAAVRSAAKPPTAGAPTALAPTRNAGSPAAAPPGDSD